MSFWQEYRPTRPDHWDGDLTDVRNARYDGLTAYDLPGVVAGAGALAGVIMTVILRFFPLSPVRRHTFLFSLVFLSLLGAILGLWRRHSLLTEKTYRLFNRNFRPHALFTYFFIPFLPVVYMFILPDISQEVSSSTDTFTGGALLLMITFWMGAVYDWFWEAFHNFSLVYLNRKKVDHMHALTLRRWIEQEEALHEYHLENITYAAGRVEVTGWFESPYELQRKLLLLDFVAEAHVEQLPQSPL